MDKKQENFLKLLRNGLNNTNEFVDCSVDDMEQLALTHICVPFIYYGAKNAGLEIPENWKKYLTVSAYKNYQNMQTQTNIIAALKDADIPCAVIKGSTVSVNYPEPMARTLGDIDILVKEEDYERTVDLLCGVDYEDESYEDHKFHYKYTVNGVAVEIHKYVTEYTDDEYGKHIALSMEKALDNIVEKRIEDFVFPSLNDEFLAVTLLLHKQRHFFENRMPLRMLCDWAMFVKSVDTQKWNDVVYPFVEKMGLAKFCDAVTATCNRYLYLDCGDKIKCDVSDATTDRIIAEFFDGGVIKGENETSQSIGTSYSQNRAKTKGKIKPFIMLLNDIARNEFDLAKKSDVFLPLFWIYIPVRYCFRFLTGKRSKLSFGIFNETAERKEYLIKELNLRD